MDKDKQVRLELLKKKQRERNLKKEVENIKAEILSELSLFDSYYRFANLHEIKEAELILSSLPAISATSPDFRSLHNVEIIKPIENLSDIQETVWCIFTSGTLALFEIMPCGSMKQFIKDIHTWLYIGSPILLLFENKNEFVFIHDYTHATKATYTRE